MVRHSDGQSGGSAVYRRQKGHAQSYPGIRTYVGLLWVPPEPMRDKIKVAIVARICRHRDGVHEGLEVRWEGITEPF